jgi:hypothetical protein
MEVIARARRIDLHRLGSHIITVHDVGTKHPCTAVTDRDRIVAHGVSRGVSPAGRS